MKRVLRFFSILMILFLILITLFNRSVFKYFEQSYHKDFTINSHFFNTINELEDQMFLFLNTNLRFDLLYSPPKKYQKNILQSVLLLNTDGFCKSSLADNFYILDIMIIDKPKQLKFTQKPPQIHKINIEKTQNPQEQINQNLPQTQTKYNATFNTNDEVLLIGDSLMQGVGTYIIKELKKNNIKTKNIAKQSTGLAYKNFYNWQEVLKENMQNKNYDVIVVLMGVNDYWDIINPKNRSQYLKFGEEEWQEVYSSRIKEIIQVARKNNAKLFWYELPAVKKKSLNAKITILNEVLKTTLEDENYGVFVKTSETFGEFKAYLLDENGKKKLTRSSDGVHFTPFGYSLMAQKILPFVKTQDDEKEQGE